METKAKRTSYVPVALFFLFFLIAASSCQKRYVCAAYSSYFMPMETELSSYFYPFDTSAKPKSSEGRIMVKNKPTGLYKKLPPAKEKKKLDVFLAKEKEFYKPVDSLSVKDDPNKRRESKSNLQQESDASDEAPKEEPQEEPKSEPTEEPVKPN
ncbi:MAG: hypothetical protein K2Q22_07400 [Cytophagales bacterium]|nr:hypothetical protein [Cytophagales bacterium]